MSHWQLLSLTPDADERSIKRAYARLLKVHRPDENPHEFQRLREAYEASLAEARWRAQADEDIVEPPIAEPIAPAPEVMEIPAPAMALEPIEIPPAIRPPEPSLGQMEQWLAEGKERQLMDALRHWLNSEWLVPFEHRQQFEQCVLDWLESAPQWSPAFFEGVCKAMGWDEDQGNLPCPYWRWDRLIRQCEVQALEETLRGDLARFDADKLHGQAAALLLKPMGDARRRAMADHFTGLDWQRFTQLAESIEYQYPEVPERLGLQPLDNWRDWLPATSYRGVSLFLWFALSALIMVSLLATPDNRDEPLIVLLMPFLMPALLWLGIKVYYAWTYVAIAAGQVDVWLSQRLVPRRWYRQGAGLLVLRHVLPSAVPAALACAWSETLPWLRWVSPPVVFLGTLYFTQMALSGGRVSIWARVRRAIMLQVGRLPWHWLRHESVPVLVGVVVMAAWVYSRLRTLS
ncbi:J domain-containing protein [Pseudomonas citrulli]|uniref:J domain-containing protein n=1 Tax=Pseudomonas citrulli TaxID=3064347 RepID=A0ABT9C470_9PSED|nr:J domain-containing protein [Pseudomonas sp. K18]MDO7898348.1 J domain-containing protein [Pseudomonas sp. K18]